MTDAETHAVLDRHETSSFLSARGKGRQELSAIPDIADKLLAIARADHCPETIRFRAFESYFALGGTRPDPAFEPRDAMIAVYVAALRAGAEPNLWSLPYSVKRSPTSRHLIALGAPAARALADLLDDSTPLAYEGSEEATIASDHKLRVKDLAAGLIAAIGGGDLPEERDPAARDLTIAGLRARARP